MDNTEPNLNLRLSKKCSVCGGDRFVEASLDSDHKDVDSLVAYMSKHLQTEDSKHCVKVK